MPASPPPPSSSTSSALRVTATLTFFPVVHLALCVDYIIEDRGGELNVINGLEGGALNVINQLEGSALNASEDEDAYEDVLFEINELEQQHEDIIDQLVIDYAGVDHDVIGYRGGKLDVISAGGVFTINGVEYSAGQALSMTPEPSLVFKTKLSVRMWLGHRGQWVVDIRYGWNWLNLGTFRTAEGAPLAAESVEMEQEVKKRLSFEAGTYKIEYKDEDDELILINCDEDLEACIFSSSPCLVMQSNCLDVSRSIASEKCIYRLSNSLHEDVVDLTVVHFTLFVEYLIEDWGGELNVINSLEDGALNVINEFIEYVSKGDDIYEDVSFGVNELEQQHEDIVDQLVIEYMGVDHSVIGYRGGELDVISGEGVFTINGVEYSAGQALSTTPEPSFVFQDKLSVRVWLGHRGQWVADIHYGWNRLNIGTFRTTEGAPLAAESVELEQEVKERLLFEAGTYKIEYKDEDDELILINCDKDLEECISSSSAGGSRSIELFLKLK
ncbi:hypothetical protein RHGRI_002108 [Rhododendron griersonianum]|uniref:PB1 domain-containing protein n=1 Tax=Rhododendron griersonianum TaxID=479676 RepID=A0AAV6LNY6_9ERIC|nr:hypothetical protein RHGRI_002108 [Rhododendron griersonianum]